MYQSITRLCELTFCIRIKIKSKNKGDDLQMADNNKEVKMVDARGLSCPQPVLLTKNALSEGIKDNLKVFVDNPTARENVSRFGRSQGFDVEIEEENENYIIKIYKKG